MMCNLMISTSGFYVPFWQKEACRRGKVRFDRDADYALEKSCGATVITLQAG